MSAQAKQLHSTLTYHINATGVLMSLKVYKLSGNGSNMFVCFQRLESLFESFREFEFAVSRWANLSLNFHYLLH
jgi:hypothetical protein